MKLYQFLNEQNNVNEYNQLIQKDCKYYLSLITNKMIFTRGFGFDIYRFTKKQVRQDRRNKNRSFKYYDELNQWLKENGHVSRNNSVICSSHEKRDMVAIFGTNHFVFPIGNFNFTYVKSIDFNLDDNRTKYHRNMATNFFEGNGSKAFPEYFITNKDLYVAYDLKYEIWFDCKEYYVASINDYNWNKQKQQLERKNI